MLQDKIASQVRQPAGGATPRMLALMVLFGAAAAWECLALSSLKSGQIWSHLRMGSWILEHRAWPRVGLFSQVSQRAWRDFSWGYDALAAIAERILGLRAVPALAILFRMALAVITFLLAGGRRGWFWLATGISAVAQYVLWVNPLDAANASTVLFGLILLILVDVRQSGQARKLCVLPVLFLLWANLDLGFLYGFGLLVLFVLARLIEDSHGGVHATSLEKPPAPLPLGLLGRITLACVVAGLCTPYGYHTYESFFQNAWSELNNSLPDYAAMSFHRPQDYVLLLLMMSAALSLGLRRSRDLFLIGLLTICAFVSFHAQRESWLVVLAALAVVGSRILAAGEGNLATPGSKWDRLLMGAAGISILLVAIIFFLRVPAAPAELVSRAATTQPVRACDYVREHQLPQPLFNPYAWGGFVTWYLPEYAVSIDQRRGLYAENEEIIYFKVMSAETSYREYTPMSGARTLLMDKVSVMGEALRGMPGFKVVYEDEISLVLSSTGTR